MHILLLTSIYSKEIVFSGYPTKVQNNEDESLTLMINNDYDFSFYNVIYDGQIMTKKLSGLTKKDICDNTSEFNNKFAQLCSIDKQMLLEIAKENERQKEIISKKRGFDVSIYSYICFYEKQNNKSICCLNIEDGERIYNSVILIIKNGKVRIKTIKKGMVIFCKKLNFNKNMFIYYNYAKDKTYISISDKFLM